MSFDHTYGMVAPEGGIPAVGEISLGLTLDPGRVIRFLVMPRVTISLKDKQAQPYRFPLDRDTVTLGRGSDNDITIQSGSVSVHHAKMSRVPGGYELRDLGSTNGIKMDGEKKDHIRLKTGMAVRVGDAEFFFQLSDEELEELKKEAPTGRVEEEEGSVKVKKRKADDEDEADDDDEDDDDDDEDDEEEKPKKKSKKKKHGDDDSSEERKSSRSYQPTAPRRPQSSGWGGIVFLAFLILAAIAFCLGVAIRFQKETGKPLLDTVRSRFESAKAPVEEPKPVEEPVPAE